LRTETRGDGENFILSTIHSSKGLEYDRVYLMDVADGLFPAQIPTPGAATPEDWKLFEEERRLFYVGMTRAKKELIIFRQEGESSRFVREITEAPKAKEETSAKLPAAQIKGEKSFASVDPSRLTSDFVLAIGERIVQLSYGPGVVEDVEYNAKGQATRFTVAFDDGSERTFGFPLAFRNGTMWLESGESVDISVTERPAVVVKQPVRRSGTSGRRKPGKDSYAYWAENYPDYVVIKREGAFWSCRGESAEIVNRLLGYRLGGSSSNPMTGTPNLDAMVAGLTRNGENYIVVEDGEIIDQGDF
jgi:hypothetical protein